MQLRLAEKFNVADDVTTFVWEAEEPLQWQAGQFMKYLLPHENADDRGTSRWFTIAAPPYEGRPRITTRFATERSSSFKTALRSLEVGDTIEVTRPSGDFVIENPGRDILLVAGGIGITPYRAMLLQLDHDNVNIRSRLLYANRNEQYVFKDELESLAAKHKYFGIHYFTDPKQIGLEDIQRAASELNNPLYYLSGPEPMVEHYKTILVNAGIAEDAIRTDEFPGYKMI